MQQGQQQFSQFTDGQVGHPIWAGAEGEGLSGVAGEICGFGWLGPVSHFLLTNGQSLIRSASPLDVDLWELKIILDII